MAAPQRPSALIDFRSVDVGAAPLRLAFGDPIERLQASSLAEVLPLLERVEAMARAGFWCVGQVRYEAAPAFDAALQVHSLREGSLPLASFSVHEVPLGAEAEAAAWDGQRADRRGIRWQAGIDRTAFESAIALIHEAIAAGEVYQINLTSPTFGVAIGDPGTLFDALRRAQPNAYAAYLDDGQGEVTLSVSPELFFDWRDGRVLTRPMKGTAPRATDSETDMAHAQALRDSLKERAENLMIVDLLRNDLSRIAQAHSVRVPALFHTQAWPTVWQMCSDVVARTRPDIGLADIFRALFPCGSVTGAPKVQAMRWIKRIEPGPRGVYCGAIGVVQPGGTATFNVPIRTLTWSQDASRPGQAQVRCDIGSGVTADATADGEWAEWGHKRAFVARASQMFGWVYEQTTAGPGAGSDAC